MRGGPSNTITHQRGAASDAVACANRGSFIFVWVLAEQRAASSKQTGRALLVGGSMKDERWVAGRCRRLPYCVSLASPSSSSPPPSLPLFYFLPFSSPVSRSFPFCVWLCSRFLFFFVWFFPSSLTFYSSFPPLQSRVLSLLLPPSRVKFR